MSRHPLHSGARRFSVRHPPAVRPEKWANFRRGDHERPRPTHLDPDLSSRWRPGWLSDCVSAEKKEQSGAQNGSEHSQE